MRLEWQNSRPFPSSPEPLFQSEAKCKFICSYRGDLPEHLGNTTPQEWKNSNFGWRVSLKNLSA